MDYNHSKGMLNRAVLAGGIVFLIFQAVALGTVYSSFETIVGKSFGEYEKNVVEAQVTISLGGKITDVDVGLDLKHTSFCDLVIIVESPNGTSATISYYDIDTFVANKQSLGWIILDEDSDTDINLVQSLLIGPYRPSGIELLSVFDGLECQGVWTIKIYDLRYGNAGTLDAVRLDIATDAASSKGTSDIPLPSTFILTLSGIFCLFRTRR